MQTDLMAQRWARGAPIMSECSGRLFLVQALPLFTCVKRAIGGQEQPHTAPCRPIIHEGVPREVDSQVLEELLEA